MFEESLVLVYHGSKRTESMIHVTLHLQLEILQYLNLFTLKLA